MQKETILDTEREKALMALLKAPPKQPRTTVVQLRLDDEARSTLTRYAEYLECSTLHVVMEALKLVNRKDKDFQAWLSSQHTKTSEPTSNIVSKGTSVKGESFQLELQ